MEKAVAEWSVDDVTKFLEENSLAEHTQGFLGKF